MPLGYAWDDALWIQVEFIAKRITHRYINMYMMCISRPYIYVYSSVYKIRWSSPGRLTFSFSPLLFSIYGCSDTYSRLQQSGLGCKLFQQYFGCILQMISYCCLLCKWECVQC